MLFDSIKKVPRIKEKRAELYKKLNIETIYDLIHHFPRSYIDFTKAGPLNSFHFGDTVTVSAQIQRKFAPIKIRGGRVIYKLLAIDKNDNAITIVFFNNKYAFEGITLNKTYIFHGKLSGNFLRPELISPIFISENMGNNMQPIYPLTAGLSNKMIVSNIKDALFILGKFPATILPDEILLKENILNNYTAFNDIHFPKDEQQAQNARNLFILEELICLQLGMSGLKRRKKKDSSLVLTDTDVSLFVKSLDFTPTNAQYNAILTAAKDMSSGKCMNRLLQGDVGSGKTLVAAALIYLNHKNGGQAAFMAPTEILAIQHYNTLSKQLSPFKINVALLTSSTKAKEKREILEKLKSGEIHLLCGTHALIEKNVEFNNLTFVVTDEQHRFGVSQRAGLISKGIYPHTLIMSATPIPRSLALTIYGDLDISILDELPLGRKKIETYLIDSNKRKRAYGFIEKHVNSGHQVYIVCPAVEESLLEIQSAIEYSEMLKKELPKLSVGLLHGKMKASEKDNIMTAFRNNQINVLVSTTVIEVGVDVRNATIMMVENADRFGLSQLHQLRGRVGRGDSQSYCILVSDNTSKTARERLSIMCKTSDGFEIAKFDLKQRGPGDFFGDRQHGLPPLKSADLLSDSRILEKAQKYAAEILEKDPSLSLEEHLNLKNKVNSMFKSLDHTRNN